MADCLLPRSCVPLSAGAQLSAVEFAGELATQVQRFLAMRMLARSPTPGDTMTAAASVVALAVLAFIAVTLARKGRGGPNGRRWSHRRESNCTQSSKNSAGELADD